MKPFEVIKLMEKHQKAINVLELIQNLNQRIEGQKNMIEMYSDTCDTSFCNLRISIDTKIKQRLQKYYDKNLKI